MVDNVDELILSALSKNSKQDPRELWDFLMSHEYNLTEDEIETRISGLEQNGVITGQTITVDIKK